MSTEPEKRSDEETWARLAEAATPGPWTIKEATEAKRFYMDTMPLTADIAAADEPVAYGGPAEDGGPHVGACRLPDAAFIAAAREAVPALLAALAASRADNDRLSLELFARERENELLRGGMTDPVDVINGLAERFVAEREAARVEVSQLRAKIDAEPELVELADDDALDDLLSTMNEVGETPVIVGHDRGGRPFLAYGWAPGGDGWDCGVVEDDTHSSEFDYNDGTQRCDECGAFDRRPLTVLSYPVTVRRRKLTLPHGWKITDLSTETGHLHIALAEPLGSTPTVTQHEPHCYSGYPHFGGCDCEPLGSPEQPAGEAKSMCVTCGNYHPTANHGQCAANVAAGLHADGLNPNAPEGDN